MSPSATQIQQRHRWLQTELCELQNTPLTYNIPATEAEISLCTFNSLNSQNRSSTKSFDDTSSPLPETNNTFTQSNYIYTLPLGPGTAVKIRVTSGDGTYWKHRKREDCWRGKLWALGSLDRRSGSRLLRLLRGHELRTAEGFRRSTLYQPGLNEVWMNSVQMSAAFGIGSMDDFRPWKVLLVLPYSILHWYVQWSRLGGCTLHYVWESRAFMIPSKNLIVYERLYV